MNFATVANQLPLLPRQFAFAVHQFAVAIGGTLVWGLIFAGLCSLLARLPVWYAVRREMRQDTRHGAGSWHPEPLPLSAGSRGFRGKAGMR